MENKYKQEPGADREIDDLFRKGLSGNQTNPPDYVWDKIDKKLLLREIFRLNFTNVSARWWIIGAASFLILGFAGYFMLKPNADSVIRPVTASGNGLTVQPTPPSFPSITRFAPKEKPGKKARAPIPAMEKKKTVNRTAPETNKFNPVVKEAIAASTIKSDNLSTTNNLSKDTLATYEPNAKPVTGTSTTHIQSETKLADAVVTPSENIKVVPPASLSESKQDKVPPINGTIALPVIPENNLPKTGKYNTWFSAAFSFQPEISVNKNNSFYTKANYWGNVDLGFHLNNFSIHTGIGIGLVEDDGHYKLNYQSSDSIGYYVKVVSYTYDDTQPGHILYDTIRVPIFYSVSHIGHNLMENKYTYLQIPILIDYKLFETPKFRLFIKGGTAVSLLIGRNEPVPTNYYLNGQLISIENNSVVRKTTNWQLLLSMLFEYKLSKTLGIFVEPTYRYFFDAIRKSDNVQSQEPYSLGLGVGLMLNFGHNKNIK